MYNAELNNQWIQDLNQLVEGKRVLILGNSLSLFAAETGEFIDSFDIVVRVGKGLPYKDFKKYVGEKIDVWSFGVLRSGMIKHVNCKFKVFNFLQVYAYNESDLMVVPKFMFSGKHQIYRDFFLLGSYGDIKKYLKLFPKDPDMRISQGLATILFFIDKIKSFKELHLYGFDFFEKAVNYNLENEVKQAHSWHIPRSKFGLEHPHINGVEKKFITKLHNKGLLTFHPCPDGEVDKYVLNSLFNKFRPEAKKE